jgi:hypothetical protein
MPTKHRGSLLRNSSSRLRTNRFLKYYSPLAVYSVQTEDVFCQIDSDCCNLHHWTLLATSVRMVEFTILAL